MIIRCDNCSVSLQLDESKIPSGNFTVRCPRCQNMLRANKDSKGVGSSAAEALAENKPAPATEAGAHQFAEKQSEFEINNAMRSLLAALQTGKSTLDKDDEEAERPRRVLLCLGDKKDDVAKMMAESSGSGAGSKVPRADAAPRLSASSRAAWPRVNTCTAAPWATAT